MRHRHFYGPDRLGLSFELFPPKTPEGEKSLYRHVSQLMELRPSFITCTYGAGGSTRETTLEVVDRLKQLYEIPVATHLTCVGSTVDQLRGFLRDARLRRIDHVVALRGDPPQGATEFTPVAGGLSHANELVELIRREFSDFGIAVAGYPEKHREAPSLEVDLANLKRKVDAGADLIVTQLFYNNDDFLRFRDRCHAMGIRVPIAPGLLPVTSLAQIQRITALCGAVAAGETRVGPQPKRSGGMAVSGRSRVRRTTSPAADGQRCPGHSLLRAEPLPSHQGRVRSRLPRKRHGSLELASTGVAVQSSSVRHKRGVACEVRR